MGKIVRHTSEELKAMIARGEDRTDWERLGNMTEEEIEANAYADADNPPLTDEELATVRVVRHGRGRPKKERPKKAVSLRIDPEVLAYFKGTGKGWQSRIDAALKEWMKEHKAA